MKVTYYGDQIPVHYQAGKTGLYVTPDAEIEVNGKPLKWRVYGINSSPYINLRDKERTYFPESEIPMIQALESSRLALKRIML